MEEWKTIEGFEGLYEVSNHGNVRNVKTGRVLKHQTSYDGYLKVSLCKKKSRTFTIHRLVALAFISNPNNKPQINHINGFKTDNHISNLEWCTNSENMIHAFKNDLMPTFEGEKNGRAKLTNEDVYKIRQLLSEGLTQTAIAEMFGVSQPHIFFIKHNKLWTHI